MTFGENIVPVPRNKERGRKVREQSPLGLSPKTIAAVASLFALGFAFVAILPVNARILELLAEGSSFSLVPDPRLRGELATLETLDFVAKLGNLVVPGLLSGALLLGIRHLREQRRRWGRATAKTGERGVLLLRPFEQDQVQLEAFPAHRATSGEEIGRAYAIAFASNLSVTVALASLVGASQAPGLWVMVGAAQTLIFGVVFARLVARWMLSRRMLTVPERLGPSLRELGPFVALGGPQYERSTLGPDLLLCRDEHWQRTVLETFGRSRAVLMVLGETPGVLWELETLLARADLRRVFLLVDPVAANPRAARKSLAILDRLGVRLPRGRIIADSVLRIENGRAERLVGGGVGPEHMVAGLQRALRAVDESDGPRTVL